jgi:hypothetical protein
MHFDRRRLIRSVRLADAELAVAVISPCPNRAVGFQNYHVPGASPDGYDIRAIYG